MNTKLLLVDDHPLMLHAVCNVLGQQPNITVVGEAASGAQAVELAGRLSPDLVLMDLRLPDMDGIEAMRRILAFSPAIKILIFSAEVIRSRVDEALRAGACGYVTKNGPINELSGAIENVMAGRFYLSPTVSSVILQNYRETLTNGVPESGARLSERDTQMLQLISQGLRNKEIASLMQVSLKSVETYRARLMKKVGCDSSAELIRFAIRERIVPL